jgi:hypothetical protein
MREEKERQKERWREGRGGVGCVIYTSLGTCLYLLFPASCFTSLI